MKYTAILVLGLILGATAALGTTWYLHDPWNRAALCEHEYIKLSDLYDELEERKGDWRALAEQCFEERRHCMDTGRVCRQDLYQALAKR